MTTQFAFCLIAVALVLWGLWALGARVALAELDHLHVLARTSEDPEVLVAVSGSARAIGCSLIATGGIQQFATRVAREADRRAALLLNGF